MWNIFMWYHEGKITHMRHPLPFCTLCLVALIACSEDAKRRGELVVAPHTNLAAPKDIDALKLEIVTHGSAQFSNTYDVGPSALLLPATMNVLAGDDPSQSVTVRLTGLKNRQPRTLREALTTVPASGRTLLRLPIDWLCDGQVRKVDTAVRSTCPTGETCIAGTCKPMDVDSSDLPEYVDGLVFGGGTTNGDGNCFDTLACFAEGSGVAVDSDCTVPAPANGRPNVAMVLPPDGDGVCSGTYCLVVLDQDAQAGWKASGDRIQLPPAVCDKLGDGTVRGIVTTAACATKTIALPTCGSWSAVRKAATPDAGALADVNVAPPDGVLDAALPDAQ